MWDELEPVRGELIEAMKGIFWINEWYVYSIKVDRRNRLVMWNEKIMKIRQYREVQRNDGIIWRLQ